LVVLDKETGKEARLVVEPNSPDEVLEQAAQMLTAALRPPEPRTDDRASTSASPSSTETAEAVPPTHEDLPPDPAYSPEPGTAPSLPLDPEAPGVGSPSGGGAPEPDEVSKPGTFLSSGTPGASATDSNRAEPQVPGPALLVQPVLFPVTDPLETIVSVFRALAARSGLTVQDVLLSLPPAFTDRRFEVLAFDSQPVESVLEMRSDAFAGFYLTHLRPDNVLLVYANSGRHIEFGPARCELQATVASEPDEFRDAGLLGLTQDGEGNFVFLVTPEYRAWAATREKAYLEASARFLTPAEAANAKGELTPIWPPEWPNAEPREAE
jgi:hypothetical protein